MKIMPQKIKMIDIKDIKPNPYQTRRNFNLLKLNSLANSIKESGILSPVILRSTSAGYEIIAGNRRVNAAKIVGMKEIPSVVIRANDRDCALLSLSENINRENLTSFEEAEALYNLLSYHKIKRENLVEFTGGDRVKLSAKLKLLSLPHPVRFKIEQNPLSGAVLKELLKIHDSEDLEKITDTTIKESLSAEEVSLLAKKLNRENRNEGKKVRFANIPICTNTVKKTVNILKGNGETVEFSQKEDENYIEYTLKVRKQSIF